MTYVWVVTYDNRPPEVFYGDNKVIDILYDVEPDDIEQTADWFHVEDYCTGRLVKVK